MATTYSEGSDERGATPSGVSPADGSHWGPTPGVGGSGGASPSSFSESEPPPQFSISLEKMGGSLYVETKPCGVCAVEMRPRWHDSPDAQKRARARHAFKSVRTCSPKCQGALQRRDPARSAKTRSGASNTAKRLKPYRPCERCGETRQSHVHHKNRDQFDNRLENLERLCIWCHAKEHAEEARERAPRAWATRRARG